MKPVNILREDPEGVVGDENAWENEDPNLLNDHALLFKEAESLPVPPVEPNRASDEQFLETVSFIRELVVENNIALEAIAKKGELIGNKDTAVEVIETLTASMESSSFRTLQACCEIGAYPKWEEDTKTKVFSEETAEKIRRWKETFAGFCENYQKMQQFIPNEALEDNDDVMQGEGGQIEHEKHQAKYFPSFVDEAEQLLNTIKFME